LQGPAGSGTLTAALGGYTSASEPVTLTAGATTQAATLQLAPVNPGNVTGLIVNSAGTGLAGAAVSARGLSTTSAADGSYTLNNLPAGSTTISALLSGFQSGSATVTVVAATTTAAPNITLASGSGSITGTVKSTSGTAIAGASVGFGGGTTTTNASGVYTLNGVPVGTVQLVASATGFQSVTQNVTVTGGATATANFTLAAGSAAGAVTGKVTNISSGAVLGGATVSWSGGSATTNTSGIYTLSNLTAGSRSITATKSGYLARTSTANVTGGTATLNFQLATAGKISVKVVGTNGAVVSGVTVTIKGGAIATTVSGSTATTGIFATSWIPVGTYTVTVAKTGHTTKSKSATVTSGVTTSLTFTAF
jgi:hypothetical protein